jgi:hypothetical protein
MYTKGNHKKDKLPAVGYIKSPHHDLGFSQLTHGTINRTIKA